MKQSRKGRPLLGLGPFTILAFILASFYAYQAFASGRIGTPESAGRIVYEADRNGKLRRVERPTVESASNVPLWKPEPSLLAEQASKLRLTPRQKERILAIDRAWTGEKRSLERTLETAFVQGTGGNRTRKEGGAIPAAALTQSMEGYAELSTLYNQRRESHWVRAFSVLTPGQQSLFEQIRMESKR